MFDQLSRNHAVSASHNLRDKESLLLQIVEVEEALVGDESALKVFALLAPFDNADTTPLSVELRITDFYPFLYLPIAPHKSAEKRDRFVAELSGILCDHCLSSEADLISIEHVTRQPLLYHRLQPEKYRDFVKISVASESALRLVDRFLSQGRDNPHLLPHYSSSGYLYDETVYESNLKLVMQFMTFLEISTGSWIEVRGFELIEGDQDDSTCSLVLSASHKNIVSHSILQSIRTDSSGSFIRQVFDAQYVSYLKHRILSLEMLYFAPDEQHSSPSKQSRKFQSSTESNRQRTGIMIIANYLNLEPRRVIVLSRVKALAMKGVEVHHFDSEYDLLSSWISLIHTFDPDILVGYNITENLELIRGRLVEHSLQGFGRDPQVLKKARTRQRVLSSKLRNAQHNLDIDIVTDSSPAGISSSPSPSRQRVSAPSNRAFNAITCIGRIVMDIRVLSERVDLFSMYSFGEIVEHYLNQKAEYLDPVTIRAILEEENGTSEHACDMCMYPGELLLSDTHIDSKSRVLNHHSRNSELSFRVLERSNWFTSNAELSRITGLNISDVMYKGQMIRFQSQLLIFSHKIGYIIPSAKRDSSQGMTEGSLNLMPKVGYDDLNPVVILDFKSLYPSIIMAHNLCYSTQLLGDDLKQIPKSDVETLPARNNGSSYFISRTVKRGVVPEILKFLISERQHVKKQLKTESDSYQRNTLDLRQLALKVCANAIYGTLGSPQAFLQSIPIAEATVMQGARMLARVQHIINKRFHVWNGKLLDNEHHVITPNALALQVVYGDTDSVFIRIPRVNVQNAIDIGKEIARLISKLFPDPIELNFERVLFPSLLIQRKRYAGLSWTNATKYDSVDIKGLESQRRDCPMILKSLMLQVLDGLFVKRDQDIVKIVQDTIDNMMSDSLPLDYFIITKGLWLGTTTTDYKTSQAHVEVVQRMDQDEAAEISEGERVQYVFVRGSGRSVNDPGYLKTESLQNVIKHAMAVDYRHYLDHFLVKPLGRILELVLTEEQMRTLFTVRKLSQRNMIQPKQNTGSRNLISSFLKTEKRCYSCKVRITAGVLCETCQPLKTQIHLSEMMKLNEELRIRMAVHATCRQCQKVSAPILCQNTSCNVFYQRLRIDRSVLHKEDALEW